MVDQLENGSECIVTSEIGRKDTLRREACVIECEAADACVISFSSSFSKGLVFTGHDLFDALVALRLYLEKDGWYLLCACARLNAYPSRMSREMSKGRRLSLLYLGKQARQEDKANVFDPATINDVASVAEQQAFFESWLKSL